jgi:general secretion pathway protein G
MRNVLAILPIVLLVGCGGGDIDAAKLAVAEKLIDPESAQYRNVEAFANGNVCGEVNAKNRMGGYTGFDRFIYSYSVADLDPSDRDVSINCVNENYFAAKQKYQEKTFGINLDMRVTQQIEIDLREITLALNRYRIDNYVYPSTKQGISALMSPSDFEPKPRNFKDGGYLENMPRDPWGREYLYESPGSNGEFDIITLGADGKPGGEGENKNLGNWMFK